LMIVIFNDIVGITRSERESMRMTDRMEAVFFQYGETEIDYLKRKDKRLGEVIDKVGHIYRQADTDLFSSVVHHIVGQQISTKAQESIWNRMICGLGTVSAETVLACGRDELQRFGISFRKADYILSAAEKVMSGEFDPEKIKKKDDAEVIEELSALKGIGVWTAEMILLFCLQRPNVFSFGDLAILRGLRMLYHHREITRERFERYRKRFSPYCSVASLYLWAVAGGTVEGMRDYAPADKHKK
jgi:DNA-3-methyladenine glycosylase II